MIELDTLGDVYALESWANEYAKYGPYVQPPEIKWSIAIYQVSQGISWEGTDSEYESYAAAAIHMIGSCAMRNDIRGIQEFDTTGIAELEHFSKWEANKKWKRIMYLCGRGQQLLHYASKYTSSKAGRKTRWNPGVMALVRDELVRMMFGLIPPDKRLKAIHDAIDVMTGRL
jgi:hypothetical protein